MCGRAMTLFLNNDDIRHVLTMEMTLAALDRAYHQLAAQEAVCRPRIDIQIPTGDPTKIYQWGTMEGGSIDPGYFAIRMKSDIAYESAYEGVVTHEKYASRPGLFCGLIILFNVQNAEPLAIINDGYLQHFRVGADSGIGVKYMAREDARVVGMLGSGGMARSHLESITLVRKVERVQVFSPTREHRETYAREMAEKYDIEAVALDNPRDVFRGADIVCGCTDSARPVIIGEWIEAGAHVTCVGGRPDDDARKRVDVALRLGSAPGPVGLPEWKIDDENVTYAARRTSEAATAQAGDPRRTERGHGVQMANKTVFLEALLTGGAAGRTSPEQITFSERGNIQGAQFFAVAGAAYEAAEAAGVGRHLPTEWFLQDIRD
ncbi:MAG: Ornithine cyclodeaminase [Chloroflexi bacterium]|nr:Ornithine cyclodeaminase [Chloroflexota bacterium]